MELHELKIRQHFVYLAKNTSNLETILDAFITQRILSTSDQEEIVDHPGWSTKRKAAEFYTRLISKRGVTTIFPFLIEILRKTTNGQVADRLEKESGHLKPSVENIDYLNFVSNGPGPKFQETWNLPTRRLHFTGRQELLSKIEAIFHANVGSARSTPIVAIYGLGGVGKSSLAIQYCWNNLTRYKFIAWFSADSEDLITHQLNSFGIETKILDGPEVDAMSIAERARKVKHWFETSQNSGWLIVLDNVVLTQSELKKWMPVIGGDILVTSRLAFEWDHGVFGLDLAVFSAEECHDYVTKVLDNLSEEKSIVDDLGDTLGRLPLALAQACAYIKKNHVKVSRYLQLYHDKKLKMLSDNTLLPGESANSSSSSSVYLTWDLSIDAIRKESELSSNWLVNCGYLFNNGIPTFLLERFAQKSRNNPSDQIFEEARGMLSSYSLMNVDSADFSSVHCLVQEVIRLKFKDQSDKNIISALELLNESFPRGEEYEELKKKRILLPHLEVIKAFLIDYIKDQTADQQEGKMLKNTVQDNEYNLRVLLSLLSDGYGNAANHAKQLEVLEKLAALEIKDSGRESLKTVHDLGLVHGFLGDAKKALIFLEKALQVLVATDDYDQLKSAAVLTNIGKALGDLCQYPEMKVKLLEALTIYTTSCGDESVEGALTQTLLADCEFFMGEFDLALERSETALRIFDSKFTREHPHRGAALAVIIAVQGQLGNLQGAHSTLKESLEIHEGYFGDTSPETARTRLKLANIEGRMGHVDEEEKLLENALSIFKMAYKPDHPVISKTQINLASAYQSRKQWIKSIEILDKALAIQEQYFDPESPQIGVILQTLAAAYGAIGDTKKNIQLMEQVLEITNRHFEPNHSQVALVVVSLATAYGIDGQHEKHKNILESALPNLDRAHPSFAVAISSLAVAEGELGNLDKKCELLEQALEVNVEVHGLGGPPTMNSIVALSKARVELLNGLGDVREIGREILGNLVDKMANKLRIQEIRAYLESQHSTPMHIAAAIGDLDEFRRLLNLGADVLARNDHNTVLHSAVSGKNLEIVRLILASRPAEDFVNSKDNHGNTPLAWAAEGGAIEIAKCLIEEGGADVNLQNSAGKTPLNWAIRNQHFDLVKLLANSSGISLDSLSAEERDILKKL